ncbi:unnamed protein product [Fraxinus pennsylvanica]|uniref:Retrotransposon Copia-like N-terminal domain-containing protein n=1 Tax=Fraxinus pennsylvanica TaxID=56036 RepID=A0AAD1ZVL4_9LAMI|nr:unnamed protein product [Fraxinus pennsylvanica]
MAYGNMFPANGNLISLNAYSQIPFNLAKTGGNYSSWKSQMTNILFGYGLLGFADETYPCPQKTDSGYSFWTRQDRLVLLGIQATVHSIISPTINNCTTSANAWINLETSFANRSSTRVLSIMPSLMSNKKEGKTVATHMSRVKSLTGDLAAIGYPLNDAQILSFLDEELIHNHGEAREKDVQVTAQLTLKYRGGRGGDRSGQGSYRGGYNNNTHGSDSNLYGHDSQPNHMQTNRQLPYGRGINFSYLQSYSSSHNPNLYQRN